MSDFSKVTSFIWSVADLIRDSFKRGQYQSVILPFTVLRRLDCVLAPNQDAVRAQFLHWKDKNLSEELYNDRLTRTSGFAFYNTSPYTFKSLVQDGKNLRRNMETYLNGFSPNMREVIDKFNLRNILDRLQKQDLLFKVTERFAEIDLHPEVLDNHEMGSVFEELIRKFNEANNENPGEHFTPRDVVTLMARLLLEPDREHLQIEGVAKTICDPCCGSGGMLTVTRDLAAEMGLKADFDFYGQEVNPETYAVCKSDLFMQSTEGGDAENIQYGSTLAIDRHKGKVFDYLIANPPYGKDWKRDKEAVEAEAGIPGSRFSYGLPRISDGQMLFLTHMAHHLRGLHPDDKGRGRMTIILNGSPLFTGDAGSGESNIRQWLMENDLVEAVIALPEQIFYNTGIATYIWVLNAGKDADRKGKVQLINANSEAFWQPMRKSLGDKRREISKEGADTILRLFLEQEEGKTSKFFDNLDFGYRKIVVERPLCLKFRVDHAGLEAFKASKVFLGLAVSRKKKKEERDAEVAAGLQLQQALLTALEGLRSEAWIPNAPDFLKQVAATYKTAGLKLKKTQQKNLEKALVAACGVRDPEAEPWLDQDGKPIADPELRDTETMPLKQKIADYMEQEVLPHVPNAWVDHSKTKVGYEIPFTRHFYEYKEQRPLVEIESEIRELEKDIQEMLAGVFE